MNENVYTIGVGGAAGEGAKGTGAKIGRLLRDCGLQVYLSADYPSLIRGGHNFVRLSFGKEKIWCDHKPLDVLVALNDETQEIHKAELKEGAWVLSGLTTEQILEKVREFLDAKSLTGEADVARNLTDGNTALADGFLAAGLDFYFAYPMTPTTSVLHYLAGKQKEKNLKVIQPENEIAVANMGLGAAYAGKRAAVGTATGGFALMQESFSFAAMAELPLVFFVAQRQGPATGVPTKSSQSDLRFVLHAGHGEFPRIVLSPGDPEEAFLAGADALNLAWKFRTPVIVLSDKVLSEHMMTADAAGPQDLKAGEFEADIPGTPDKIVKATSYEHNAEGLTVDKPADVLGAVERRFAKAERIEKEAGSRETVKIYGQPKSDKAIVFWGSTKAAVLEAAKNFKEPVKLVQVLWLSPFPGERLKAELHGKKIVCIEGNLDGQLASLIREKTGIEIGNQILRYDSMPFDPDELTEKINSWN